MALNTFSRLCNHHHHLLCPLLWNERIQEKVSNWVNGKQVCNKGPLTWGPVSESENCGKMPGGSFKEPRTVTHVPCGLGCKQPGPCPVFPSFHHALPPMLTPAPCLLRMWLCNVLSFSSDLKGKCSFSFEPFLLDPYQERTLSASLGALSSLDTSIGDRAVFFLILK